MGSAKRKILRCRLFNCRYIGKHSDAARKCFHLYAAEDEARYTVRYHVTKWGRIEVTDFENWKPVPHLFNPFARIKRKTDK